MFLSLQPVDVTSNGSKDSEDVRKLKVLRWGGYPGLSGGAPKVVTSILLRGRLDHGREGEVSTDAR